MLDFAVGGNVRYIVVFAGFDKARLIPRRIMMDECLLMIENWRRSRETKDWNKSIVGLSLRRFSGWLSGIDYGC